MSNEGRTRALRVAMITGTQGSAGGIAGYTEALTMHLRRLGVDARRVTVSGSPAARLRAIREAQADINHVQFPSRAFGLGLAPLFLSGQLRPVVTVHESSDLGPWPVAMVRVAPLTVGARALLATQEFDRAWIARWMPWTRKQLSLVPVGNAVGIAPAVSRHPVRVMTFGLLRPWRGMERLPEFARQAREAGHDWQVRVVGATDDEHAAYAQRIRRAGERVGIEFTGQLPDADVAAELASATVGYFPFPDGACERHTSLLAALANGLPVVGTVGQRTSPALRECLVPASSPEEAVKAVARLMADPAERERLSATGRAYAARFSWERIAAQHIELYERIVASERRP